MSRVFNKTVFLLGAGFSCPAGLPPQNAIVRKILELHDKKSDLFDDNAVESFKQFLEEVLLIPPKDHENIPLEDVFTPLDRSMLDNITFRECEADEIVNIRETIYRLIGTTLLHFQETNVEYIDDFARYLFEHCKTRSNHKYRSIDPVSVISTNWDTLLDDALKRIIDKENEAFKRDHREETGKCTTQAVVDYCCYISSFNESDESVKPGLEVLGAGGFNIKLVKLHGSLNWLQCSRCLRVYIDFHNNIFNEEMVQCRHCDDNYGNQNAHKLSSNLIMPTFLKDLSNPQYKLIWQNAGVELSEAARIVFIGYSLPQADFEMRQLLSRMVRNDAVIEVIDYAQCPDQQKKVKDQYQTFFGRRKCTFHFDGVIEYFNKELQSN